MCSGEEYINSALSVQWQISPRANAPSTSSSRWPWLCGGRSTTDACLYRWRLGQKKTRRGPPAALLGACVWRHAWGDGVHCPSGRHGAKYRSLNHHLGFESLSKISNFRGLGCSRKAVAHHHQSPPEPRIYVQRSSGFCWIPPVV
jgi:hypothetical protein